MRGLRQNRWFITFSFVILAAGGAWMAVAASGPERVMGIACLVMFGGGGLAWIVGEFVTPPAGRPRRAPVEIPGGTRERGLIVPIRAGRLRFAVVAQACFAVAALLIALYPQGVIAGGVIGRVVLLAVFAILAVSVIGAIRTWDTREPLVALTPGGILTRSPGDTTFVPWTAIASISEIEVHGAPYLTFTVTDSKLVRRSGGASALGMLERPLMGHDHAISPSTLGMPGEEFVRLVRYYRDNPAARASLASDTSAQQPTAGVAH